MAAASSWLGNGVLAIPSRIIATCCALVAFAAAIVIGVAADLPASTILWRAMIAMVVCWGLGCIVGTLAFGAVQRDIEEYKKQNPINPMEARLEESTPTATEQTAP